MKPNMKTKNLKITAISLILTLSSSAVVPAANFQATAPTQSYKAVTDADAHPLSAIPGGDYIIEGSHEGAACRDGGQIP